LFFSQEFLLAHSVYVVKKHTLFVRNGKDGVYDTELTIQRESNVVINV